MRHAHLAALFVMAAPLLAQTEARPAAPEVNTEKLWKIETAGLGGWGAASQALRVGSILKKEKGIKNLVFDTCGVGYFEIRKGYEPDASELNELLLANHENKVKITSLKETDVQIPDAIYEVTVAGLGWMSTAQQTREVLSKLEGVIRVHPFGHNGKAYVLVSDKDKFTEEVANDALTKGTKDMRVRKMKRVKSVG